MKEALKHGLCNNILAPMVYAILELVSVSCLVIVRHIQAIITRIKPSLHQFTLLHCKLMHFHILYLYALDVVVPLSKSYRISITISMSHKKNIKKNNDEGNSVKQKKEQ